MSTPVQYPYDVTIQVGNYFDTFTLVANNDTDAMRFAIEQTKNLYGGNPKVKVARRKGKLPFHGKIPAAFLIDAVRFAQLVTSEYPDDAIKGAELQAEMEKEYPEPFMEWLFDEVGRFD